MLNFSFYHVDLTNAFSWNDILFDVGGLGGEGGVGQNILP